MPVGRIHCGKSPFHALSREALVHPWVFINVLFVIEVDESVPRGRDIEAKSNDSQEQTQEKAIWFL
jgi:hypothetical protein